MSRLPNLQKSLQLGSLILKNRVIHSSQTRNRAVGTVPNHFLEDYYTQRSGAGLLLSEGTLITPQGSEWPNAPGIWNTEQVEGWRRITTKVHDNGSYMFCQLWHIGRVAHPLHQSGQPALAPSNIGARGGKFRLLVNEPGYVSDPSPIKDPRVIIEQYRNAAVNAKAAGFDGVELHSANGYLPHQFIEARSNQRTDEWGGSVQNRARFSLEIIKVLIDVMGDSKRVGIKLSPGSGYNDMGDPIDVLTEEYTYLITELDALDIGYIQLVRYSSVDPNQPGTPNDVIKTFGPLVKKPLLISNAGYSGDEADTEIAANKVAAVAFGRPFVNNPDLPSRFWNGQEIDTLPQYAIWYSPQEGQSLANGYTDFPVYKEKENIHPAA